MSLSVFEKKIIYLKGRKSEPQMTAMVGVGHTEAKSWELNPGLLPGWQEASYLNHHHCLH